MRATTPDRGALSRAMEPFATAPSQRHLPFGAASNVLGAAAPPFVPRDHYHHHQQQQQQQPLHPQVILTGGQTQQQPLGAKSAPATPYSHGMHALPVSPLTGCVSIPGSPMRPLQSGQQPSVSDYFHRPKDLGFADRGYFPSPRGPQNLPQSFQQVEIQPTQPGASIHAFVDHHQQHQQQHRQHHELHHRHQHVPPWLAPTSPLQNPSAGSSLAPSPLASPRTGGVQRSPAGPPSPSQLAAAGTLADPLFQRLLRQAHGQQWEQQWEQYQSPAPPPCPQQHSLYKTELCRSWEETGTCRYGAKCQFSHGRDELRPVLRHPKYKTEVCRTFAQNGTCPYGTRCRFIHQRAPTKSVLGTLVAGAHAVIPSDWRPEGRKGSQGNGRDGSGTGGGGSERGGRRDSEDAPRRLPIFQRIAADEEDEGDEKEREALIARTRKRIPTPRVFPGLSGSAAKPPSAATGPPRFDIDGSA